MTNRLSNDKDPKSGKKKGPSRLRVLVVDNFSPFTEEILNSLRRLEKLHIRRKFFEVTGKDLAQCDKVILSGRRKYSREINMVNSGIIKSCRLQQKPILGICYGAEILALTLGGSISKMPSHIQGMTEVSITSANPLTEGKSSLLVYESHRYCIAKLPLHFKSLASSRLCKHEVFSGENKLEYGTQFHPEKSGDDGLDLLKNFVKI
ncbi:MAG: glutamine amidotransferase-related protein [Nitrososphaera sp.]